MAKKNSAAKAKCSAGARRDDTVTVNIETASIKPAKTRWRSSLGKHWLMVVIVGLAAFGTLGAGLKYLEEDAQRQIAERRSKTPSKGSFLNAVNPFLPTPTPTPTPQLAREYIYAGSRLLAVEDKEASAAPPADIAVWRRSTGYWYVMGSSTSQPATLQWGASNDIPVPGDYDGDGKTDFAVFRPDDPATTTVDECSGGCYWYIVKSSDGNSYGVQFAANGDIPVPGDYDGDGKTDLAVYRPDNPATTGTDECSGGCYWYITKSSDAGLIARQHGLTTDKPTPADFDGDGKTDIAVWREASSANFYSVKSSNTSVVQTIQFGTTGDKPLPADYDGDGTADPTVRRGTDWHILQSSNNTTVSHTWGNSTDTAVQNDYDGDGKVDVAVWRVETINSAQVGVWYIRNSSTGSMRTEQWGTTGDVPVPAFWRR